MSLDSGSTPSRATRSNVYPARPEPITATPTRRPSLPINSRVSRWKPRRRESASFPRTRREIWFQPRDIWAAPVRIQFRFRPTAGQQAAPGNYWLTAGLPTHNGTLYRPIQKPIRIASRGETTAEIQVAVPPTATAKIVGNAPRRPRGPIRAHQHGREVFQCEAGETVSIEDGVYEFRLPIDGSTELSMVESFAPGDAKEIVFDIDAQPSGGGGAGRERRWRCSWQGCLPRPRYLAPGYGRNSILVGENRLRFRPKRHRRSNRKGCTSPSIIRPIPNSTSSFSRTAREFSGHAGEYKILRPPPEAFALPLEANSEGYTAPFRDEDGNLTFGVRLSAANSFREPDSLLGIYDPGALIRHMALQTVAEDFRLRIANSSGQPMADTGPTGTTAHGTVRITILEPPGHGVALEVAAY